MDLWRNTIVKVIKKILNPKGIYERSDSPVRIKEGLDEFKGVSSMCPVGRENGFSDHIPSLS